MTAIFLTGASGYIGGQVLLEVTRRCPDIPVSILVRDSEKGNLIRTQFPRVRVVLGDLDNAELLQHEAAKASIVLHLAATGHLDSVKAIHTGLKQRDPAAPTYWIQVSGASVLAAGELSSSTFVPGSASSTIFDDLSEVSAIRDLIRAHPSRNVDNYMVEVAAEASHIKSALVIPPLIYGEGEGIINRRSQQLPALSAVTLEKGHGVRVGAGLSIWDNVHVRDVGRLFGVLTEAAVQGIHREGVWGKDALYLTGVGAMNFRDISYKLAKAAKDLGYTQSDHVDELDPSTADKLLPRGTVLFGTNARSHSRRGRELLQWEPKEESLEADIDRVLTEEEKRRKGSNIGQAK